MTRVDELGSEELNGWVAKATGDEFPDDYVGDWCFCGPLIERFGIFVDGSDSRAEPLGEQVAHLAFGGDLKTAICRAVVASVYGEEVPDE